ncbi:CvpA family protein [Phenylobacterium immobile]|uniref:CvpA family protein n=1 Tax=Phenylobacterium immobile TaxID=21 RepID=UPI000B2E549F|nr:CvpA family protein [Phenylobacterium immobile]
MGEFSQFDLLVFLLLLVSAAVGFVRGAVREITALLALIGAVAFAIIGLPWAANLARKVIDTSWLAIACGVIALFAVAYVALRLVGAHIARRVQRLTALSVLDRSLGLAFGLGRGLVVLGILNLMFNAATPDDLKPRWITNAATWPLAQNMGRLLGSMAPTGLDAAGRLRPAFDRAVGDASGDRTTTEGYDARQREGLDDLVEKYR